MCAQKEKNYTCDDLRINAYVSHITLKEYKTPWKRYSNIEVRYCSSRACNEKKEFSTLEGTDALKNCDVLLIFAAGTTISGKALDDIRHYVNPETICALRTSSHGFEGWLIW